MNINWKAIITIAVLGVSVTTAVLIVRHVKKKKDEKKKAETLVDNKTKEKIDDVNEQIIEQKNG